MQQGGCYMKQTVHTLENIEVAGNIIEAITLHISFNHLPQEIGVSSLIVYCILTKHTRLFPYKLQMLQTLSTLGKHKCVYFVNTIGV